MNGIRAAVVGRVLMVATGAAHPVFAADADALISQGVELRKGGRDLEALPLFRKAAEQQPTPRAIAQLGTCEQAVGLWVDAEAHIEQALKQVQDPWIRKNEVALREALVRIQDKLGSVEIWGNPDGAKVSIDGQVVGKLPATGLIRTPEGRRTVTVAAPGFSSEKRTVEVHAGAVLREHVVLASIAAPQVSADTPTPQVQRPELGQQQQPPPADPTPEPAAHPIYKRWWFWTLVGTVVVAGGISAYFVFRSDSCEASMGGSTCVRF